jgi:hypothetical protein
LPLPIALFPDGRLASRGWRWTLPAYLALGAIFLAGIGWSDVTGVLAPQIQVDSSGELATFSGQGSASWITIAVFGLYAGLCLAWVVRQLVAWLGSTGERRQQLKWLISGGVICISGLVLGATLSGSHSTLASVVADLGAMPIAALPIGIGVGILKYRLYEIDRLISRTLSYAIVTGLLVAVFLGIIAFTTRALPFSSPVAVTASTLTAAALFNPLRRRVQRLVDHRFNRTRYDAETILAAFTSSLRDAIDLDTVGGEMLHAVDRAVKPVHASIWIRPPSPSPRE